MASTSSQERLTLQDLPEIGENTRLTGEDLFAFHAWAKGRRRQIDTLNQEVKGAGKALDDLWQTQPELLIGPDLDNPNFGLFKPQPVYEVSAAFGLRIAQHAAFQKRYEDEVKGLNAALRAHLVNKVIMTARAPLDILGGIQELHYGGRAWGKNVGEATGKLVDCNIDSGVFWIRTGQEQDYGIQIPFVEKEVHELALTLYYPSDEAQLSA